MNKWQVVDTYSGVGDLRMLIKNSGYLIADFSLTLASKTLRIHQRPYSFNSLDSIVNATKQLNPMKSEGYVVCDRHFKRLKIKSAEYVAISLLQSDHNFLAKRILEVVVNNESSEFLTYYPQWFNLYCEVKHKYDSLIKEIKQKYLQYKDLPDQKDFALAVKHLPYSKVLFDLRNGRANSVRDSLASIPRNKLANLLAW